MLSFFRRRPADPGVIADGALANFSVSFALPDKYPSLGYCARVEIIGTEGALYTMRTQSRDLVCPMGCTVRFAALADSGSPGAGTAAPGARPRCTRPGRAARAGSAARWDTAAASRAAGPAVAGGARGWGRSSRPRARVTTLHPANCALTADMQWIS